MRLSFKPLRTNRFWDKVDQQLKRQLCSLSLSGNRPDYEVYGLRFSCVDVDSLSSFRFFRIKGVSNNKVSVQREQP